MKLVKGLFFMLGIAGLFSVYQFDAMAKKGDTCAENVQAGRFCKDGKVFVCRAGCYCTGNTNVSASVDVESSCDNRKNETELNKANIFLCPPETPDSPGGASRVGHCKAASNCDNAQTGKFCKKKDDYEKCPTGCWCPGEDSGKKATGDLTVTAYCNNKVKYAAMKAKLAEYGINYCPDKFPYTAARGAEKAEKCYRNDGGVKLYYKKSKSYAGGYLKKNTNSNSACEKNYWCPGGEWYPDPDKDQGIYACPSEYPYSTAGAKSITDCYGIERDSVGNIIGNTHPSNTVIVCAEGKYFDANTQACKDCPVNHVCPGVTVTLPQYTDRGICNSANDPLCKFNHNGVVGGLSVYTGGNSGGGIAIDVSNLEPHDMPEVPYHPVVPGEDPTNPDNPADPGDSDATQCNVFYVCGATQIETETVDAGSFNVSSAQEAGCNIPNGQSFTGWVTTNNTQAAGSYTCDSEHTSFTFIAQWTPSDSGEDEQNDENCTSGYYIGTGQTQCVTPCPAGYYCPGGTNIEPIECPENTYAEHTGMAACAECTAPNQVANNRTACNAPADPDTTVSCEAGWYLPGNSGSCAVCTAGHYCPSAGTYTSSSLDQGIKDCGNGTYSPTTELTVCMDCVGGIVNSERTSCSINPNNTIHVSEGWYLPANSVNAAYCGNGSIYSTQFCPGGDFYPNQPYAQGIYNCLNGGTANSLRTSCTVTLDKYDLREGISGGNACWLIGNNPIEYKDCVFEGAYDPRYP